MLYFVDFEFVSLDLGIARRRMKIVGCDSLVLSF